MEPATTHHEDTAMAAAARHAEEPRSRWSGQPLAAWLLYLTMGGTQVSFNLYHAFHSAHLGNEVLSVLFGVVPVAASWIASHLAARRANRWILAGAIAVTVLAMALSIGATATVVDRGPGLLDAIGFGALLDIASLIALAVILLHAHVAAEEADALARAAAVLAEAKKTAASARAEAAGTVRLERERTARTENELMSVRAELDRVRADLERAREAVLKGGPKGRSGSSRKPARTGPGTAAGTAAGTARKTGPSDEVDDVSLEARALQLLASTPEMNGTELADELGVTPGYARKLRRRLTQPDRPRDRSEDRHEDRLQDRPDPVSQDRPEDR